MKKNYLIFLILFLLLLFNCNGKKKTQKIDEKLNHDRDTFYIKSKLDKVEFNTIKEKINLSKKETDYYLNNQYYQLNHELEKRNKENFYLYYFKGVVLREAKNTKLALENFEKSIDYTNHITNQPR